MAKKKKAQDNYLNLTQQELDSLSKGQRKSYFATKPAEAVVRNWLAEHKKSRAMWDQMHEFDLQTRENIGSNFTRIPGFSWAEYRARFAEKVPHLFAFYAWQLVTTKRLYLDFTKTEKPNKGMPGNWVGATLKTSLNAMRSLKPTETWALNALDVENSPHLVAIIKEACSDDPSILRDYLVSLVAKSNVKCLDFEYCEELEEKVVRLLGTDIVTASHIDSLNFYLAVANPDDEKYAEMKEVYDYLLSQYAEMQASMYLSEDRLEYYEAGFHDLDGIGNILQEFEESNAGVYQRVITPLLSLPAVTFWARYGDGVLPPLAYSQVCAQDAKFSEVRE